MFETIEDRVFLSVAPPSIGGLTFRVDITSGSAPFASSGSYDFEPSSTSNFCRVVAISGGVISETGTYQYARTSAGKAVITFSLTTSGIEGFTDDFNFDSPTQGKLEARGDGGFQKGSFFLVGSESFASVSNRTLTIAGTNSSDEISIDQTSGGALVVARNGFRSLTTPLSSAVDRIVLTCGDGDDLAYASAAVTTPISGSGEGGNDTITGGSGNDELNSGSGKNQLSGGNGNDRLRGSGGRDSLYGGNGTDRLYGQGGDDYLVGGNQGDRLYGGEGNDLLIGGGSIDRLYGEAGKDTLAGGASNDHIDGGAGKDSLGETADLIDSVTSIP